MSPRFLLATAWILALSLLALPACTKKADAGETRAPTSGPRETGFHTLRGQIAFEAAYEMPNGKPIPSESEIPKGYTGVKQLRVCLYEQHGRNDFDVEATSSDDVQIACRDTDAEGNYELRISKSRCRRGGLCSRRFYLMTQLCAWRVGRAQLCVTSNTRQEKDIRKKTLSKWAEYRKVLYSETYRISLTDRTSNLVSWNLSCPAQEGDGRNKVRCDRPGRGGRWDRKNSNYGHNKEAVHAFYGAVQPLLKMGTFVPTMRNTVGPRGTHCGGPKDKNDKNWQCQDAVRIVIRDMRKIGMQWDRHCAGKLRAKHPNWFYPMRAVCLGSPLQPFAVVHELGHVIMARWLGYRGAMNDGPATWTSGTPQKTQVGEGWADFFATYSWFPADAKNPAASGWPMEDHALPQRYCVAGVAHGELHAAQFFWDLYDPASPAEPADKVQLDIWTILQVWSLFGGKRDGFEKRDRTRGECHPHGRNIYDYLHYYERFPRKDLPAADALLRHNCLTKHERKMKCE